MAAECYAGILCSVSKLKPSKILRKVSQKAPTLVVGMNGVRFKYAPEWRHPMQARYPSTDWANKRYFPTERKKVIRRKVKERKKERKTKEL